MCSENVTRMAMAQSDILQPRMTWNTPKFIWPLSAGVAALIAYIPTFVQLVEGPWQTEQEGHGPLIIAAAIYLVWASRNRLREVEVAPAPLVGWALLLFGLAMLF